MVHVAKQAQDSLDKYSSFKQWYRKKRDGQEARNKERRPKKEAQVDTFQSQAWPAENQTVGGW